MCRRIAGSHHLNTIRQTVQCQISYLNTNIPCCYKSMHYFITFSMLISYRDMQEIIAKYVLQPVWILLKPEWMRTVLGI
jgi:hypothetical protein